MTASPAGRAELGDAEALRERYGWRLGRGEWDAADLEALGQTGAALEAWLGWYADGAQGARAAIRRAWGGTTFHRANGIGRVLRRNHTESDRIYLFGTWSARADPRYVPVHELAHVLDNRSHPRAGRARGWLLSDADLYGGGVSDVLARRLDGEPERCWLRCLCPEGWHAGYREPPLTGYGHLGPSEDFAETLVLAVLQPERVGRGSLRRAFMHDLARALAGEVAPKAEAPLRCLVARG